MKNGLVGIRGAICVSLSAAGDEGIWGEEAVAGRSDRLGW